MAGLILNYNVKGRKLQEEEQPLSNEVKMSMQEKLNDRLASTQAKTPESPMAMPAQSEGFGRTQ